MDDIIPSGILRPPVLYPPVEYGEKVVGVLVIEVRDVKEGVTHSPSLYLDWPVSYPR